MRRRIQSPAARDAARQARADRERAAGIPDRPPDTRQPFELDLRAVGGPHWRAEPRPGHLAYRVFDAQTGKLVMRAPPKTILRAAADQLARGLGVRNLVGLATAAPTSGEELAELRKDLGNQRVAPQTTRTHARARGRPIPPPSPTAVFSTNPVEKSAAPPTPPRPPAPDPALAEALAAIRARRQAVEPADALAAAKARFRRAMGG